MVPNRNYENTQHFLDTDYLEPLKEFLIYKLVEKE